MERYNRHIILSDVGQTGQDLLCNAKVLVIGAGGLGCPVLQYLAAAGIGTLGIIDFDTVDITNLQRQILFGTSSIGKNKALAAKRRLEDLNPTITIEAFSEQLTHKNALNIFDKFDVVVDGTDNFATRYLVNDAAILTNTPFVYGAIYKFEGQVSVFNYKQGPSYRCTFPNPPKPGAVANCSEVGVLGVLPGIIGTMMANEVLKIILGFEGVLTGKLLCYNSRSAEVSTIKVKRNQAEIDLVIAKPHLKQLYNENSCEVVVKEISAEELLTMSKVQIIDVRESHEQPKFDATNCVEIPLGALETQLDLLDKTKFIVAVCQSGIRSKKAIEILNRNDIRECYSLKGGISSLIKNKSLI